jgi:hypothetical protein
MAVRLNTLYYQPSHNRRFFPLTLWPKNLRRWEEEKEEVFFKFLVAKNNAVAPRQLPSKLAANSTTSTTISDHQKSWSKVSS